MKIPSKSTGAQALFLGSQATATPEIQSGSLLPAQFEICTLGTDDQRWSIIEGADGTSIYHRRAWAGLIEAVYGHQAKFIVALDGKTLIDVLPVFLVRHPVLPIRKLVSTPFEACHGGFLSDDFMIHLALISRTGQLARQSRARYVEIRSRDPMPDLLNFGYIERNPFFVSELDLGDIETNEARISKRHRKKIRSSLRKGVETFTSKSLADVDMFTKIALDHYRSIGVPFSGKQLMREIKYRILDHNLGELVLARWNGSIVGGVLLLFSGNELIFKYGAYRKDGQCKTLYSSFLLFWECIRLGIEKGFQTASFGVTNPTNSGLIDFKARFGCQTTPLHFYFKVRRGESPDHGSFYVKFALLRKIWSTTPTALTGPIGHRVSSWFC